MKEIFFVGNARCYHTMDWFRTTRRICPDRRVALITDLVDSEGHKVIIEGGDDVRRLVVIDRFLFRHQSRLGDKWRNLVKLAFIPVQALQLRRFAMAHPGAVFHSHTMYYMCLCALAGIRYIGTPQGSEVLVRPNRSRLYRMFARHALGSAATVTVDSTAMQEGVRRIAGRPAVLVQNGIDVVQFLRPPEAAVEKSGILSIRGFTDLYRIDEIVSARNSSRNPRSITFIYPFWDDTYRAATLSHLRERDVDLGRIEKEAMLRVIHAAELVVSIPRSDSSPRSVYEAIFAGAPVAAVHAAWVDLLPDCMRSRLILVDNVRKEWLDDALERAVEISKQPYVPSDRALELFSQDASILSVVRNYYDK
jgi:hypothetical protein